MGYWKDIVEGVKRGYAEAREEYQASEYNNDESDAEEDSYTHIVWMTSPGSDTQAVIDFFCDYYEFETKRAKRMISYTPIYFAGNKESMENLRDGLLDVGAKVRMLEFDEQIGIKVLSVGDKPHYLASVFAEHMGFEYDYISDSFCELPAYFWIAPEIVESLMAELKELGAKVETMSLARALAEAFLDNNDTINAETRQALASALRAAGMDTAALLELIKKTTGLNLVEAVDDFAIPNFYALDAADAVSELKGWLAEQGVSNGYATQVNTGNVSQARFCSACGNPVTAGMKFCTACGNRIN